MFEEKKGNRFLKVLLVVCVVLMGLGATFFLFSSGYISRNRPADPGEQSRLEERTDIPMPQQIAAEAPAALPVTQSVAKSATPGVVGISVLKVDSNSLFDRDAAEKWGVGSGLIVTSDGYILTNHHVAGGRNKRIVVSLHDGRNADGVTKWSDPVLDLAVVKVNLTGLPVIPLGNSDTIQVGEPAIAIGNPLGLQFQRSVTSGIVSALNRTIKIEADGGYNYMEDLIQTDASINPGNSGGPLLNSKGEAIGINTIKVTSAEAIGFAIPINVTKPILQKFVEKNEFIEPYMGVFAYDREVIPYLDGNLKIDNGIYVVNIDENGPAAKSGIKVGCIIKQIDGITINTMMQLRTYIYTKNPGDTINVTHFVHEKGRDVTVPVRLDAKEKDGLITR
jgi:S1-C subfamily serine protease